MKGRPQHSPRNTRGSGKEAPRCGHPERRQLARFKCSSCYYHWLLEVNPTYKKRQALVKLSCSYTDAHLRRHFGITLKEYKQTLRDQKRRCKICLAKPKKGKKLCIDHNHKTKKFRGLLCTSCNILLGIAKDRPQAFKRSLNVYKRRQQVCESAIAYLQAA